MQIQDEQNNFDLDKKSNEWMIKMQIIWCAHVTQSNDVNERKWEPFRKKDLMMKWNDWMNDDETHAKIQIWKLWFE